MKLVYLKSALKCNSFDVTIGIKIAFFRVSVTIEPGRSITVRYHELFDYSSTGHFILKLSILSMSHSPTETLVIQSKYSNFIIQSRALLFGGPSS